MEAFNDNLLGGKRLVKALERDTPIGTMFDGGATGDM
jgi:hypothetical protein